MHIRFKVLMSAAALACVLSFTAHADAKPTPRTVLLVVSKTDHTLAIIDPATRDVLVKLPVGPDPHEVAVSPDGKFAYVSNMGDIRFHEINVLDLVNQKALASIDTGGLTGTHGLAYVGGKLWFTAQGAKSIARYSPETQTIDWVMGTGRDWSHMIVVTPDSKTAYVSNIGAGSVSVFDNVLISSPISSLGRPKPGAVPYPGWVHTEIPTADGNEGIDLSPDGKEVWTASPVTGEVFVIDTATKAVSNKIDAKFVGANRLKFTPNGKYVLISNYRTGELLVLDPKTRNVIKQLSIGTGASGILISPDSSKAYIACTPDGYVAIFDLKALKVTGHIDSGPRPDGLGWAVR